MDLLHSRPQEFQSELDIRNKEVRAQVIAGTGDQDAISLEAPPAIQNPFSFTTRGIYIHGQLSHQFRQACVQQVLKGGFMTLFQRALGGSGSKPLGEPVVLVLAGIVIAR